MSSASFLFSSLGSARERYKSKALESSQFIPSTFESAPTPACLQSCGFLVVIKVLPNGGINLPRFNRTSSALSKKRSHVFPP